jgi:PAS domain-containing protein
MEISLSRFVDLHDECWKSSKESLDVDEIDALIIGINLKGEIKIWNQFAASAMGFPADKALGRDLYSTLSSTNRLNFKYNILSLRQFLDNAMRGTRPLDDSNFLILSGKKVEMSLKLISWQNESGRVHGVLMIGHGISGFEVEDEARLYTHSQELRDLMNRSEPLRGGGPNSPINMEGRTKVNISFFTPNLMDCSKTLVGEQDPGKEAPVKLVGSDAWHDIQSFANGLDALIFGMDAHGKVNLWNDKSVRYFGCSREEAMGTNFVQVA